MHRANQLEELDYINTAFAAFILSHERLGFAPSPHKERTLLSCGRISLLSRKVSLLRRSNFPVSLCREFTSTA